MPSKSLEKHLLKAYQKEVEEEATSREEAQRALAAGRMQLYYSEREQPILPDVCWALEKYQQAGHWYRHNAETLAQSRQWREAHADEIRADYQRRGYDLDVPIGISLREATAYVRAGMTEKRQEFLQRAYEYESGQGYNLKYVGMHAAQIGLTKLTDCAEFFIPVRLQSLDSEQSKQRRRARELVHSEPAEVAFLLGRYEQCSAELGRIAEGEELLRQAGGHLYDDHWEERVFRLARGLRAVLDMMDDGIGREKLFRQAVDHLEAAMEMSLGATDYNELYFERLYTLMALDVLQGREPNPTPFAGSAIPPDGAVAHAYKVSR